MDRDTRLLRGARCSQSDDRFRRAGGRDRRLLRASANLLQGPSDVTLLGGFGVSQVEHGQVRIGW